jgi:hypothetical protein
MNRAHPELALERLLLALERDVIDSTDEELLAAARELGMNPAMKGSAAFSGLMTRPTLWPLGTGEQRSAADGLRRRKTYLKGQKPITREQVSSWLAALTPREAKALRARFGIDNRGQSPDEEEVMLHALARELAILQKKQ